MQVYKPGQRGYDWKIALMNSKPQRKILPLFAIGRVFVLCLLLLWLVKPGAGFAQEEKPESDVLRLLVNGHRFKVVPGRVTSLPAQPAVISFAWQPELKGASNKEAPIRFRYKLEGYDSDWREQSSQMRMVIGFLDHAGDEVGHEQFYASGQTPGWTGSFATSPLQHRQAIAVVPRGASSFWVTITSAGAPETLGVIVVANLVVRATTPTNGATSNLLALNLRPNESNPEGWMIDGTRAKMAQVVKIGSRLQKGALAVLDDNPSGHAQWNTLKTMAPQVTPGEELVIEWDEMFSVGAATPRQVDYQKLPPGHYRFFLAPLNLMGEPIGTQYVIAIEVPIPFWQSNWFWVAVMTLTFAGVMMGYRYRGWRRLQADNIRLEHQQSLERERFRIAQDIHDDMGARVTQISLASAVAERNVADPAASKEGFQRITEMSRELVASLHDTIWVVNPDNDNLEAVGNYLCQVLSRLLSQASLSCRLEVPPLPSSVPITSHQRHNLSMAVKEVTNNIIKHADASEVRMSISLEESKLNIHILDNGHGFDPESVKIGSGLGNLKRRLEDIGGTVVINSRSSGGTEVHLQMSIQPENNANAKNKSANSD